MSDFINDPMLFSDYEDDFSDGFGPEEFFDGEDMDEDEDADKDLSGEEDDEGAGLGVSEEEDY